MLCNTEFSAPLESSSFTTTTPPAHVGIIMDGNGRWATARGLPRHAGHREGIAAVRRTVEEACNAGIAHLTLYAFSTENWKRPSLEVSVLWELLTRFLVCERPELMKNDIRLTAIGRRDRLPLGPRSALELTERLTHNARGLHLRLALDYGSQWAIVEAARNWARMARDAGVDPDQLDISDFERQLQMASSGRDEPVPAPDLLIRTGGEVRLSNFLLWECAYTELWFTPVLWPDFQPEHFRAALEEYSRRKRNFGELPKYRSVTQPTQSSAAEPQLTAQD